MQMPFTLPFTPRIWHNGSKRLRQTFFPRMLC
jgi:hypothetical protein